MGATAPDAVTAGCDRTLREGASGRVAQNGLDEISGIEAGVTSPGVLWVHEDSGAAPRIVALSRNGATRATLTLRGARAVDWEDIAAGPGPVAGGHALYVGDIGDNLRRRREIVVYRVREPVVGRAGTIVLPGAAALRFRYPDGPRNAEALVVDPASGALVVIEKTANGGPAGVYAAPPTQVTGRVVTLRRVGTLRLPSGSLSAVTAADVSADGSQLAVRTYLSVLLWHIRPGATVAATLTTRPCAGPLPLELQGEAIAFLPGGRGYVTVAEGSHPALHTFTARG